MQPIARASCCTASMQRLHLKNTRACRCWSRPRPGTVLRLHVTSFGYLKDPITTVIHSSKYDHPALYSSEDAFSLQTYWDKRYAQDPLTFEWYRDYQSLAPILTRHLPKDRPVLQVGVGTSRIQADMAQDGYTAIHSVDYSPVAIQRLKQVHVGQPALTYAVADVRSMPEYADSSYAGILDKGTLDALLCGDDDTRAATEMMSEVWRLLQPGASYVMVTSAAPASRLNYICTPQLPWAEVKVYEVGQQGALDGPWSLAGDSADVLELPKMGYSHVVYVCVK